MVSSVAVSDDVVDGFSVVDVVDGVSVVVADGVSVVVADVVSVVVADGVSVVVVAGGVVMLVLATTELYCCISITAASSRTYERLFIAQHFKEGMSSNKYSHTRFKKPYRALTLMAFFVTLNAI